MKHISFFLVEWVLSLSGWIKFAWVFSNLENTCKYYLRSRLLFCCDTCNSFYIFKFHYMIDDTAQLYEFGLLVSVLNGIFIVKLLLLYCITKSVFYPYTFTCNLTVLKFIHFQLMEIYFFQVCWCFEMGVLFCKALLHSTGKYYGNLPNAKDVWT